MRRHATARGREERIDASLILPMHPPTPTTFRIAALCVALSAATAAVWLATHESRAPRSNSSSTRGTASATSIDPITPASAPAMVAAREPEPTERVPRDSSEPRRDGIELRVLDAKTRGPVLDVTLYPGVAAKREPLIHELDDDPAIVRVSRDALCGSRRERDDLCQPYLWIEAAGYAPTGVETRLDDEGERTVLMQPAAGLIVAVIGADGTPARATVHALVEKRSMLPGAPADVIALESRQGTLVTKRDHVSGASSSQWMRWDRKTDEQGIATFDALPALEVSIAVSRGSRVVHRAARPVQLVARATTTVACELGPSIELNGSLKDEHGAPQAGVRVWLARADGAHQVSDGASPTDDDASRGDDDAHYFDATSTPFAASVTDAQGRFAFASVPSGLWFCGAAPGASAIPAVGVRVDARARADQPLAPIEVTMPSGLTVEGSIVRADGMPASDVIVLLRPLDASGMIVGRADAEGRFALGPVARHTFALSAFDAAAGSGSATVAAGARDVRLTLGEVLSLRGRIVDDEGAPLAIERVWMRIGDQQLSCVLGGEHRSFSIPVHRDVACDLVVKARDRRFAVVHGISPSSAREDDELLRARAPGRIAVRTRDVVTDVRVLSGGVEIAALPSLGPDQAELELDVPTGEFELRYAVDGHERIVACTVGSGEPTLLVVP